MTELRIGRHYTPGGNRLPEGIEVAAAERATAMQVFAGGNRRYLPPRVEQDRAERVSERVRELGAWVLVHAPYVINLASADPETASRGVEATVAAMDWAHAHGLQSVLVHFGSAGDGDRDRALDRLRENLCRVLDTHDSTVTLLLEGAAGGVKRRAIGTDPQEIASVIDRVPDQRLGVCLDTAHLWAAGYDPGADMPMIRAILERRLRCVHVNAPHPDVALGGGRDRHAPTLAGSPTDLATALRAVSDLPLILEASPAEDLALVRGWLAA